MYGLRGNWASGTALQDYLASLLGKSGSTYFANGGKSGIFGRRFELTFDQNGVLQDIARRTKSDSLPVSVIARTTPSPGTEASFMQQLLGNIGRFSPAGIGGPTGGGGGAGGAPTGR